MKTRTNEVYPEIILGQEYKGIGGWLIIIIIRYVGSILLLTQSIYQIYNLYSEGTMGILIDNESEFYNSKVFALINYELIGNIILLVATVIAIIIMFNRKKFFPKYAIVLIISSLLFVLFDLLISDVFGLEITVDEISGFTRNAFGGFIWITYFIRSKRVKNTFAN